MVSQQQEKTRASVCTKGPQGQWGGGAALLSFRLDQIAEFCSGQDHLQPLSPGFLVSVSTILFRRVAQRPSTKHLLRARTRERQAGTKTEAEKQRQRQRQEGLARLEDRSARHPGVLPISASSEHHFSIMSRSAGSRGERVHIRRRRETPSENKVPGPPRPAVPSAHGSGETRLGSFSKAFSWRRRQRAVRENSLDAIRQPLFAAVGSHLCVSGLLYKQQTAILRGPPCLVARLRTPSCAFRSRLRLEERCVFWTRYCCRTEFSGIAKSGSGSVVRILIFV